MYRRFFFFLILLYRKEGRGDCRLRLYNGVRVLVREHWILSRRARVFRNNNTLNVEIFSRAIIYPAAAASVVIISDNNIINLWVYVEEGFVFTDGTVTRLSLILMMLTHPPSSFLTRPGGEGGLIDTRFV